MTQTTPNDPVGTTPSAPADIDVKGALESLAALVDQGVVTPEEYAVKKAEWLRKYGPVDGVSE
jgi:hypothetical protein